jgi:hypothetical protein
LGHWESGVVQPAFETLLELVEACSFELDFLLKPRDPDAAEDARLSKSLVRSPLERVRKLMRSVES